MNEQNLNQVQASAPPIPATTPATPVPVKPRLSDLVKDIFYRFRQNRKIFRLVVTIFIMMFVIIILGIIFSAFKNGDKSEVVITPTPQTNIQPGENGDDETFTKLDKLKSDIIETDIYQKRLTPPSVNFNISF